MQTSVASATRNEQRLFKWIAVFVFFLVFVGFSRTWFLHSYFHLPAPSQFLRIHAFVMSGWIVIYLAQTLLVYTHHTSIHRKFGYFGAAYASLTFLFGVTATFLSARREVRAHSAEVPSYLNVLGLELTQMFLFALFVFLAIWWRRNPAIHKRLMLVATLCMLPNPIVRLFLLLGVQSNLGFLTIWAALVLTFVLLDAIRNRQFYSGLVVAATVAILALYAVQFISVTQTWQQFASRIVS